MTDDGLDLFAEEAAMADVWAERLADAVDADTSCTLATAGTYSTFGCSTFPSSLGCSGTASTIC